MIGRCCAGMCIQLWPSAILIGTSAAIPCFVIDANQLILPAFGSFTGGHSETPREGRQIYISTGKAVVRAA